METNEKENGKTKKIFVSIAIVLMLLVCIGSISFAAYTWSWTSDNAHTISTCSLALDMLESDSTITLTNPLPTYDADGKTGSYFDFFVSRSGSCTNSLTYSITVTTQTVDSGMTALTNSQVKFYLEKCTGTTCTKVADPALANTYITSGTSGTLLSSQSLTSSATSQKYRFRTWIASTVDASSWTKTNSTHQYKVKLGVSATA